VKEYSSKYSDAYPSLEATLFEIQCLLNEFRNKVIPIGYDIDEGTFVGSCRYENEVTG